MGIFTVREKRSALFTVVVTFLVLAALVWAFETIVGFYATMPGLAWPLTAIVIVCLAVWLITAGVRYAKAHPAPPVTEPGDVDVYSNDTVDSLTQRILAANYKAGVMSPSVPAARRKAADALQRFNG